MKTKEQEIMEIKKELSIKLPINCTASTAMHFDKVIDDAIKLALSKSQERINDLKYDNAYLAEFRSNTLDELGLEQGKVEKAQERVKELEEENTFINRGMINNQQYCDKLKSQLDEKQEKIIQLADNLTTMEANKDAYKKELAEKDKEIEKLKLRIQSLLNPQFPPFKQARLKNVSTKNK